MLDNDFKTCGYCARRWSSRDEFLSDSSIHVIGYQADIEELELGLLMFNHKINSCGTTLAVPIGEFFDLYKGPRYVEKRALTPGCPRYCLDKTQLSRCHMQCECAQARETVVVVKACLDSARSLAAFLGEGAA